MVLNIKKVMQIRLLPGIVNYFNFFRFSVCILLTDDLVWLSLVLFET